MLQTIEATIDEQGNVQLLAANPVVKTTPSICDNSHRRARFT